MFGLEGVRSGEQGDLLAVGVGPARLLKVPKTDLLRLSLESRLASRSGRAGRRLGRPDQPRDRHRRPPLVDRIPRARRTARGRRAAGA